MTDLHPAKMRTMMEEVFPLVVMLAMMTMMPQSADKCILASYASSENAF
jgi:hypothetical protein